MKPAAFRLASFCAGALILSACGSSLSGGRVCTEDFRYGLNVTVVDSVTNAPPASAVLIARSGAFVDSVGPRTPMQFVQNGPPVLLLSSAGERAGTYDLTVRSPGYRDWTRTGVEVTEDECHVRPITLSARLQK
jgi:hypothetical protein